MLIAGNINRKIFFYHLTLIKQSIQVSTPSFIIYLLKNLKTKNLPSKNKKHHKILIGLIAIHRLLLSFKAKFLLFMKNLDFSSPYYLHLSHPLFLSRLVLSQNPPLLIKIISQSINDNNARKILNFNARQCLCS